MTEVVINAAKRTPGRSFLGSFAATPAHELGRIAIEAALAEAGVAAEEVSEVILGQVLTAGQGQNPARPAAINAGIRPEDTAIGLNQAREDVGEGKSGFVRVELGGRRRR